MAVRWCPTLFRKSNPPSLEEMIARVKKIVAETDIGRHYVVIETKGDYPNQPVRFETLKSEKEIDEWFATVDMGD